MKARRKSPMTRGKVAVQRKLETLREAQERNQATYRAAVQSLQEHRKEYEAEIQLLHLELQQVEVAKKSLHGYYLQERSSRKLLQRKLDNALSYMTVLAVLAAAGWGMYLWRAGVEILGG